MKDLSSLQPAGGATFSRKRVGRGPGTGLGKTCGKGHNGQNSRSGGGVAPGFEGGQMPLARRLPKRGFRNHLFRKHYELVTLSQLDGFDDGATVDAAALVEAGIVKKRHDLIKVLANGELTKKLTVRLQKFSKAAQAKIEALGGNVEVL